MTLDEVVKAAEEGSRFKVSYYDGIAFYFHREETVLEGFEYCYEDEIPTGNVLMIMVGDDHVHVVDPEDIEVIPDDAYCRVCGQIGCRHNVYT